MENENITILDIETLRSNTQYTYDYSDDYLVVSKNLEHILLGKERTRLSLFLIIYCASGMIQVELNDQVYLLREHDLLVSLPNKTINKILASPDHKAEIVCLSPQFLQHIIQFDRSSWKAIHQAFDHPQKHIPEDSLAAFNQYYELINSRIYKKSASHKKEILQHLFSAFFHEMIAKINDQADQHEADEEKVKQPDFVFKRFIELLTTDNGKHRSVAYFANELCYSPKYLSRVVKQVCGKNALTIINEHTIELIKFELRFSCKSIKEISLFFDFPNVSFFTKYVKKNLGMTPTEFRNKKKETNE